MPHPAEPPFEDPSVPGQGPSDGLPAADGNDTLQSEDLEDMVTMDLQALADAAAAAEEARAKASKSGAHAGPPSVEVQRELDELAKRETELTDQLRRLAADFNNFRNRTQRDIQMAVDQAEKRVYNEILPALDNFERGLEANYTDLDAFRAGVDLIRKQFMDALRRLGVEPIQLQVGDPFDALHAEALTTMENPALSDGAVAAVYEKGFNLRGQLLRPARVVVNRRALGTQGGLAPEPSAGENGGTDPAN